MLVVLCVHILFFSFYLPVIFVIIARIFFDASSLV